PEHDRAIATGLSDEIEDAQRYLAGLASRLRAPVGRERVPTILTQACSGDPAERISREAALWHTELIVMSTHGRGGLGRLVRGRGRHGDPRAPRGRPPRLGRAVSAA